MQIYGYQMQLSHTDQIVEETNFRIWNLEQVLIRMYSYQ